MLQQQRIVRLGAAVCAMALMLRLIAGTPLPLLLYLETGRRPVAGAPVPTEATEAVATEPTPTEPIQQLPAFSELDLTYITMDYQCAARPALAPLMAQPLTWDLQGEEPTVLIIHTHATESFAGTPGYRSLEEAENMLSIGAEVARILEENGIRVIHDKTLHDHPSYDEAYSMARKTVQAHLAAHPTVRLVLDLHRDASSEEASQFITSATVGGQKSAQLMLVMGTDENLSHPHWQENLALALKLTAAMEQENPGICRPVQLRKQRFNMDLSVGGLLVEVGAAGNSHPEAILAANALAQGILLLSKGTQ